MKLLLLATLLCLSAGAAGAHPPRGIVADGRGRVYFSDLERIWRVERDGRLTMMRPGVAGRHVHELAIDRAGSVHGEETSYDPATRQWPSAIWKMNPAGRVSYVVPQTRSPALGTGLWRDVRGCTYLAQQDPPPRGPLLFRRCPRQAPELLFGDRADARAFRQILFSNLGGTAIGPDGSFYFRHGATVRRRFANGRIAVAATGLPVENFGIAVGGDGALYAAEHAARRVVRIGTDGARKVVATGSVFWAPTGVTYRSGALYILEAGQRDARADPAFRVRKLGADGKIQTLATLPPGRRQRQATWLWTTSSGSRRT